MNYKVSVIQIPDEEPFANDAFERERTAQTMTQFVCSLRQPFVIALDSPWGTGKTTYLKMWMKSMKNSGNNCLYFNAWENDFSENALISLIAEISALITHVGKGEKSKIEKILDSTKSKGIELIKLSIPTMAKIATHGLLDLQATSESALSDLASNIVKKQIEEHGGGKEVIESFRKNLHSFIEKVRNSSQKNPNHPIIFVIDELDRCRPNFAVELLEKLKHLFNVPGLVFVLAMDLPQLCECIKSFYGAGLNAEEYLRRFIDLRFRLPIPEKGQYVNSLFERFGITQAFQHRKGSLKNDQNLIKATIEELADLFGFTLRQQENCFSHLAIGLASTPKDSHIYPVMFGLLIALRISNYDLYVRFCSGNARYTEILEYLKEFNRGEELLSTKLGMLIEAHLIIGIQNEEEKERIVEQIYEKAKNHKPGERPDRYRQLAESFTWVGENCMNLTAYVHKKIELAHQFVNVEEYNGTK